MDKLIHTILTEIKFLYPCITYAENVSEKEFTVVAETKVSKIHPIKVSVPGMESLGEDFFGRLTFKDEHNQYYCELDGELYFKGNDIEGEPHYPVNKSINYEIPALENEIIEINPYLEQVKEYIENNTELKLIKSDLKVKIADNPRASKIFCYYTLQI